MSFDTVFPGSASWPFVAGDVSFISLVEREPASKDLWWGPGEVERWKYQRGGYSLRGVG